jgi:hypothetical protein
MLHVFDRYFGALEKIDGTASSFRYLLKGFTDDSDFILLLETFVSCGSSIKSLGWK